MYSSQFVWSTLAVFSISLLVQRSDGECTVGNITHLVGDVWQETDTECVEYTCLTTGGLSSKPCASSSNIATDKGVLPPCCKVWRPPPPFGNVPRPNLFREGKCKEGNTTFQVGDIWNFDPACVEHVCLEDGSVQVNRCPPVPEAIPEGWKLKAENEFGVFPFCCPRALPPPDPKNPGCSTEEGRVSIGETLIVPGHCLKHLCVGVDQWLVNECPHKSFWKGWEVLPGDLTLPFPHCCGRTVPILDIVPDLLDDLPASEPISVTYGDVIVDYGNELTPSQVKDTPTVIPLMRPHSITDNITWQLLLLTDLDVLREHSENREFLHWMVGNIPDGEVSSGQELAGYIGAGPPPESGLHRYVFLLYKQPGKITFKEPVLDNTTIGYRTTFSARELAKKYDLGTPIAFNVFRAKWDHYVTHLYQNLGLVNE